MDSNWNPRALKIQSEQVELSEYQTRISRDGEQRGRVFLSVVSGVARSESEWETSLMAMNSESIAKHSQPIRGIHSKEHHHLTKHQRSSQSLLTSQGMHR